MKLDDSRLRRARTALLAACTILLANVGPVYAENTTGEVVVTVRDAATSKPLADARVLLLGASFTVSRTDVRGDVRYTDVPPGVYRIRIILAGYGPSRAESVAIAAGRTYAVAVALARSGLQVIGTTSTRTRTRGGGVNTGSAERSVSSSLEDALDKQPGVTVTTQSSDSSSSLSISLRNHDESQTGLTLDGITISAPGSATNLRTLSSDLFSGASVSFTPTAGAPAGTVNFRTLEPTANAQLSGQAAFGAFDAANDTLAATGSAGRLAYALQHTSRGANRPQTFQTYLDQSGLSYEHGGESRQLGDLAKLRYSFGDGKTTLTTAGLLSNNRFDLLCTQFTTNVPCGSGPGNSVSFRSAFAYAALNTLAGETSVSLSTYTSSVSGVFDASRRFTAGSANPFSSSNGTLSRGVTLTLGAALGSRNELTFTAAALSSVGVSTTAGSALSTGAARGAATATGALSDAYRVSPKLTLTGGLSFASQAYSGKSTLASLAAAYRPGDADTLTLSLAAGGTPAGLGFVQGLADPADAQFDCRSGTTVVRSGGDAPQPQAQTSVGIGWTHTARGGRSFSAELYRQVQRGGSVLALVRADGTTTLNSAYVSALAGAWNSPYACGGTPFSSSGVYLAQAVAGTTQRYQGVDVSARLPLGRGVLASGTYSLAQATVIAVPGWLRSVASDLVVGSQLPGRPMHRAGLTLDGYAAKSGTEAILNLQYTGGNNFQHRGPYSTVSASLSHPVGAGRLTLSETNVFGTGATAFATDDGAQPLPLSNGSTVTLPAFPLGQRTLTLTYGFTFGGSPLRSSFEQSAGNASATQQILRQFAPRFEAAPAGADPFAPATDRAECGAAERERATPLLVALSALVKTGAGTVPGFSTKVQRDASGAIVSIALQPEFPTGARGAPGRQGTGPGAGGPEGPGSGPPGGAPPDGADGPPAAISQSPAFLRMRSFFACAYVQAMTPDEARAAGFGIAQSAEPARPIALFAVPQRGIVVVRPPELPAGGGSVAQPSPTPAPTGGR